jgi:hypothetical protein
MKIRNCEINRTFFICPFLINFCQVGLFSSAFQNHKRKIRSMWNVRIIIRNEVLTAVVVKSSSFYLQRCEYKARSSLNLPDVARNIETSLKQVASRAASYLAYSSSLKMETICFSETSVGAQRTTRRHIPKDRTLQQETSLC